MFAFLSMQSRLSPARPSLWMWKPPIPSRMSNRKSKIKKESLRISNDWFSLESNWKMAVLCPITTFRRNPLFIWCSDSEVDVVPVRYQDYGYVVLNNEEGMMWIDWYTFRFADKHIQGQGKTKKTRQTLQLVPHGSKKTKPVQQSAARRLTQKKMLNSKKRN